jgi:hypothetical protein
MNACDLWQLQPLNKQLLAGYKTFSTSLKNSVSSPTRDKLSCPFFIHLGPNYHTFEKKVFIVGKETAGWVWNEYPLGTSFNSFLDYTKSQPCRERLMMEAQSECLIYMLEKESRPFYRALKTISKTNNGTDFLNSGFVWDDLIAVDYKGGSIGRIPNSQKKRCYLGILKRKTTDGIKHSSTYRYIFFTGEDDNYDLCFEWILDLPFKVKNCPSLRLSNTVINDVKCFSWKGCRSAKPIQCYRTHHPQRMRFLGKTNIIDMLASLF